MTPPLRREPRTAEPDRASGTRLLRRAGATVFAIVGALALTFAAGALMNPPASDTVVFTYTATNVGSQEIRDVRLNDPAAEDFGTEITCPESTLKPGERMACTASVAGPADAAHASRITTALMVAAAAWTGMILTAPSKIRHAEDAHR